MFFQPETAVVDLSAIQSRKSAYRLFSLKDTAKQEAESKTSKWKLIKTFDNLIALCDENPAFSQSLCVFLLRGILAKTPKLYPTCA